MDKDLLKKRLKYQLLSRLNSARVPTYKTYLCNKVTRYARVTFRSEFAMDEDFSGGLRLSYIVDRFVRNCFDELVHERCISFISHEPLVLLENGTARLRDYELGISSETETRTFLELFDTSIGSCPTLLGWS